MLTLAAYRELGGVEGSLARRAETVFKDLPDAVEAELPKVLNALVSIGQDGSGGDRPQARALVRRVDGPESRAGRYLRREPAVRDRARRRRQRRRDGRARGAALALAPGAGLGRAESREPAHPWSRRGRRAALGGREPDRRPAVAARQAADRSGGVARARHGAAPGRGRFHPGIDRAGEAAAAGQGGLSSPRSPALAVLAAGAAFLANQQRVRANEALAKVEVEAETAKQTTNFMTRLFEVSDPSEARGNTITAREIMDRGAERIQKELTAQPRIQATLMETMGTVYTSLGLYDQAVSLLAERARQAQGALRREASRGRPVPGPARRGPQAQGRVRPGAADAPRGAGAAAARCSATSTPTRRAASTSSPTCSSRMGDFAEAEPLFREALALRRKLTGKQEPGGRAEHRRAGAQPLRPGQLRRVRQADARGGRDAARAARRAASRPRGSPEQSRVDARRDSASSRKPSSCTGRRSR